MTLDTVAAAGSTPEAEQPYAELGLKPDEYARIREILGRRPTSSELAMYSVMWSEHCSYKSSKVHLRQFGEKAPPSDASSGSAPMFRSVRMSGIQRVTWPSPQFSGATRIRFISNVPEPFAASGVQEIGHTLVKVRSSGGFAWRGVKISFGIQCFGYFRHCKSKHSFDYEKN